MGYNDKTQCAAKIIFMEVNMKKLVLFLCTGALVMGLASCGGNGNEGQGSSLADGSASESFSVESSAPENAGNSGQPASDPSG